jgi:hypothetical protein
VDVVLDGLARGFLRGLEQGADVDIETDIGKGCGDDLGAPVVAVLAELGDQHARPSREKASISRCTRKTASPSHRSDLGAVAGEDLFQRVRNLANRRPQPRRLDCQCQQIALACAASVSAASVALTRPVSPSRRICARRSICRSRVTVLSISRNSIAAASLERFF